MSKSSYAYEHEIAAKDARIAALESALYKKLSEAERSSIMRRESDVMEKRFLDLVEREVKYNKRIFEAMRQAEDWDAVKKEHVKKWRAEWKKEEEVLRGELRDFGELIIENTEQQRKMIVDGIDVDNLLLSLGMYDVMRSNTLYEDDLGGVDERLKDLRKKLRQNVASQNKFKENHGGYSNYVHCDEYWRFFYTGIRSFGTMVFDVLSENIVANVSKVGYDESLDKLMKTKTLCENYMKVRSRRKEGNVLFYTDYVNLKLEELKLTSDIHLLRERIKEERRIERERLADEMRAQKEFERELRKARADEEEARKALERAEIEAAKEKADKERFAKLQEQIEKLKEALKEAEDRGQRIVSMAQQTRRGWVYIISNIGSFGEGVYKIGLTRRLDPMERVYELGDASVPFPFDVHAIIFSEDAPALETALHQAFDKYKVNSVNWRKEYFKVPLESIKEKVVELGYEVDWEDYAYAPQFRDSILRR